MNRKEKTSVAVEIFGTKYRLLADSSSASYVTMVGAHVDEQMHAIAKQHPRLDISRLAVLAAINIADDLLKTKEQLDREHAVSVERKNQELNSLQEKYAGAVQQLDEAKSELEAAKAEIDTTKSELEAAKAEIDTTKSELDAAKAEIDTTKSELEAAKAEIDTTKSELEAAKAEIDTTKAKLDAAKADNEKLKPSWRRCGYSFASRRSGP